MSITNLGKRVHYVIRGTESTGGYVDGEYIPSIPLEFPIYANIQPSTLSYRTQMLPSGDRDKEAIAIYSNEWLYTAQRPNQEADLVLYRGAQWKVVVSKPYGNFGRHCEALAIKYDGTVTTRPNGYMGVVN